MTSNNSTTPDKLYTYLDGYLNNFSSEALKDALPRDQNSPQKLNYGLYAEQLNGSSFTATRTRNFKIWFYRIRPTAVHTPFVKTNQAPLLTNDFSSSPTTPNQIRWMPPKLPSNESSVDFVQGLTTVAGAGSPQIKTGLGIHYYLMNADMKDKAFCNADADMLIVPQFGRIDVQSEVGFLFVKPGEILVMPRGIRFRVNPVDGPSRGYICETFSWGHFIIPDLGPIGANGLANPRHFLTPVAAYEDKECKYTIVQKFMGELFECQQEFSPFDVVAWSGNYVPCKYDLSLFNTMNSVSFDHADPSIFTVLTNQTAEPGVAVVDFVIFPPRWGVAEHTFRPPYYHRNCMSEYMGLIHGIYEAKEEGFLPGGGSLHSCMVPHGPETVVFEKNSTQELKPQRIAEGSLAFMLESTFLLRPTPWALEANLIDTNYYKCWQDLKKHFTGPSIGSAGSGNNSLPINRGAEN